MTTDYDIRRLHIVEGWSKEEIADMLRHSNSSVRGRVSRASIEARVAIARELAETQPLTNTGVERQKAVLRRSMAAFEAKQLELQARGGMASGVFISDTHIPYAHWAAMTLALHIVEYVQPDYISAMNDLFDFEGYGRWGDDRSPAQRLWSDDIENGLAVADEIHEAYHRVAPEALLLQVQGNHDNWMYHHIRTVSRNGFSEHNIAQFMEKLEAQGVAQFVDGANKKENIVQLSPGLKWVHGISASVNNRTVAQATVNACAGRGEEEGIFFNTVAGHTHRSHETSANGVTHWNSGALCSHDPRYLKHRPRWDTAIVVNRFDPKSRYTEGTVIKFRERGGHLTARYDGVEFDTPLE